MKLNMTQPERLYANFAAMRLKKREQALIAFFNDQKTGFPLKYDVAVKLLNSNLGGIDYCLQWAYRNLYKLGTLFQATPRYNLTFLHVESLYANKNFSWLHIQIILERSFSSNNEVNRFFIKNLPARVLTPDTISNLAQVGIKHSDSWQSYMIFELLRKHLELDNSLPNEWIARMVISPKDKKVFFRPSLLMGDEFHLIEEMRA